MESPLHHFEVHTIIPIHIGGLDLSINNAVVAMWVGLAVIAGSFMLVVNRGVSPVPGKLQSVLEMTLEFIRSMVYEFIGEEEGKKIRTVYRHFVSIYSGLQPDWFGSGLLHHHQSSGSNRGVCNGHFYHDSGDWVCQAWHAFFRDSGATRSS